MIEVFRDLSHSLHGHGKITPLSLPFILPRFFLHNFSPLKFELLLICDAWINFCQTAWCCISEDSILHSYSCETPKISHLPYRSQLLPSTSFPTCEWWYHSVPYSLSYWAAIGKPWISTRLYCWPCKSFGTQCVPITSYLINYNWEVCAAIPTQVCCTCAISLWRSGQLFVWLCVEVLHKLFYGHWHLYFKFHWCALTDSQAQLVGISSWLTACWVEWGLIEEKVVSNHGGVHNLNLVSVLSAAVWCNVHLIMCA